MHLLLLRLQPNQQQQNYQLQRLFIGQTQHPKVSSKFQLQIINVVEYNLHFEKNKIFLAPQTTPSPQNYVYVSDTYQLVPNPAIQPTVSDRPPTTKLFSNLQPVTVPYEIQMAAIQTARNPLIPAVPQPAQRYLDFLLLVIL